MNKLTESHFSFKCPMKWDELQVSGSGRYCGKCRKHVFELSNCSLEEVLALQRRHGAICGSIQLAQSAAVALSLASVACQDMPSDGTVGNPRFRNPAVAVPVMMPPSAVPPATSMTLGMICQLEPVKQAERPELREAPHSPEPSANNNRPQ